MNRLISPLRNLSAVRRPRGARRFGPAGIACCLGAEPRTSAPSASPAPTGPLAEAVAALRGISTLRADFIQTDRNGQRSTGVLTLKRPGRIRFQYAPGIPLLIVSRWPRADPDRL